jgi:hypothetical protein
MSRRKGTRRETAFARVALPNGWRVQCKARADGWRTLYANLGDADALAVRAERRPWLVVLPLERFLTLLAGSLWTWEPD